MNRRWLVNRTNSEYISYLSNAASVSPVFAQILINRGLKTAAGVTDFLSPGVTGLSDPFELPDMQKAVARIKAARRNSETVLVHGDYDTDGLTATAIMILALRKIGLPVHSFIPNRAVHGYGFNPPSVAVAKKIGAGLIVTVDCGISSFEAVAAARREGIDIIITDHHEPQKKSAVCSQQSEAGTIRGPQAGGEEKEAFVLPDAVAVVNPRLLGHDSDLSILSGAGVAFKLAQALAMDADLPLDMDDVQSLLDLAALGTVADVVPLVAENRVIVKEGLRLIQNNRRTSIRSLRDVAGLHDREIRAGLLAFTLVPRINAPGRMADAGEVVQLLLSDSYEEALDLGKWLDTLNTERQGVEGAVYEEAAAMVREQGPDVAIVLAGKGWHPGVLGIVASRIAEEYYRPTFVFSVDDGIAKGSARSIPPFDVRSGLDQCREMLLSFGGHRQAAGVKLKEEDLPRFTVDIRRVVNECLSGEDFIRTLKIDAQTMLSHVTASLVKEIAMLEPLGYGNPEPLIGSKLLEVHAPRMVGSNHLKLKLRQRSCTLDAIGFEMGGVMEELSSASAVDAAFVPAMNDWNGGRYLQLILRAIRPSQQA